MEVKIKDLKPNPYRDLENYPINREKVEALKASILQTGFWDNILARKSNGDIQIAYGHHRLVVLREVMKPEDIVDIPVKDLPDSVMIQVMANENMDEWKTSASVIDETVRVAKEFLEKYPDERKKILSLAKESIVGSPMIAKFLGWKQSRVSSSLLRINAIDEGIIDREAIKEMPTERHATEFASAMKKDPMPKEKQRVFAKEIAESFEPDSKKDQIPSREIHGRVLQEKWKPEKRDSKEVLEEKERKQKIIKMETLLRSNLYASRDLIDELSKLIRIKEELGDGVIVEDKALSTQVTGNFQRLYELLSNILKINQNEKN